MAIREMQQADVAERLDAVVERGAGCQVLRARGDRQAGGGRGTPQIRGAGIHADAFGR